MGRKKGIKVYGACINLHVAQLVGIMSVRTLRQVLYTVARDLRALPLYRITAVPSHHTDHWFIQL